jgi:hypothetical protein
MIHPKLSLLLVLNDKTNSSIALVFEDHSWLTNHCADVLVQREMDFCLIGVNSKWVTVTNLF